MKKIIIVLLLVTVSSSIIGAYLRIAHQSKTFSDILLAVGLVSLAALLISLFQVVFKKIS